MPEVPSEFRQIHATFPIAYINWSVFTSLTPTLFYFSVWELGLTGSELSLLSTLSPIVLGISIIRDIASSRAGRTILHVLSLVGLFAYLLKSPFQRLIAVAFANVVLCIGWTVDLSAASASVDYQALGMCMYDPMTEAFADIAEVFGLGLVLSSLSKHANHSNNPGMSSADASCRLL